MNTFDVAIVGTGPAGMFAALELIDINPEIRIVMFEQGPVRPKGDRDNITSGWGGAGAFSDGKLDLGSCVGGTIGQCIGEEQFRELMAYVDSRYLEFGGRPDIVDAQANPETWSKVLDLRRRALSSHLDLAYFPIRHLGTDTAYTIVENIRHYLLARGVVILSNCPIVELRPEHFGLSVVTEQGEVVAASYVLAAPGRSGADWFAGEARRLGLRLKNNGIDIGVRVETRNDVLKEITDLLYEAKLYCESSRGDRVRTFCMCPGGYVATEDYRGLRTVNGHSYKDKKSDNVNFAVLVTQIFTEPFDDSLGYGKHISKLANQLAGGGVLVQRLGDLRDGRRSKEEKMRTWMVQPTLTPPQAIPGDLGLAIPHRHLEGIVDMLDAMESIAPGIASKHTLLYGIEVKFYSNQVEVNEQTFETALPGLYVAGDGSGYTRGLLQASMNGVLVAQDIIRKYGCE
ncbi:FAD-dependent oxidoreductase [Patescibacteria group bacterium]|nr:FAD-dependent oxidoreductase [Patescibacteria group bacterium]MBU1029110.1 FAD-dependent oxidoreductase [Patescibacteria group bacterium]MBU1916014.1 FAD-dependent oxidoreductase [Patescibacteria group bacterium]